MESQKKQINPLLIEPSCSTKLYIRFAVDKITSYPLQNPIKNIICSPE